MVLTTTRLWGGRAMTGLQVGDTRAAESVLDEADVHVLRENVRGAVLRPSDDGYDDGGDRG